MRLVDDLTADQWNWRPAEGRWSIADCLEHVIRVEHRILGLIDGALREGKPEPGKQLSRPAQDVKDSIVSKGTVDRSNRRQAPDAVVPSGQWPEAEAMMAEFRRTRDRSREFVATTNGDLRSHFRPHGAFGEIDCYQWLVVMSLHGDRHAAQIEEVKAAAGFPKRT